jgi:transposase-like protein
MSTKVKNTPVKGKRYTAAEKQSVVDYVNQVNAEKGRGGQAAAAKKFGVSVLTVAAWLKAAGVAQAPKGAKVAKPVVEKAAKPAKAAVKKTAKKVPQSTRYTAEQKQTVLDYVAAVNAEKGRGGMSAAAKKFKITPLTIGVWVRKHALAGGAVGKQPKAAAARAGASPKVVAKLQQQLARTEAILAKAKALLASL